MIFRFVADYSQRSDLRREFAEDPNAVLDRYDIPEAERQHLLAGDRAQVARQLHAEIDNMLSGRDHQALIWPVYYPKVAGPSMQQAGPKGKPVEIAIPALNLTSEVRVRFHLGEMQTEATILRIDHALQAHIHTIHCQAVFPENGAWDLELINLVEGEERSDFRKSYLTVSGELSYDLLDAISAARTETPSREARWTKSA
jgi:hypothetical protein